MKTVKEKFWRIVLPFAVIFIIVIPFIGHAQDTNEDEDSLVLTLEDSIDRALENNHSILKLDLAIDSLRRSIESLKLAEGKMRADLLRYQELQERFAAGEVLSEEEMTEFFTLQATFKYLGAESPYLTDIQEYNIFVKSFQFPRYDLEAQIEKLELNKEVVKNSISRGVRQLYDGILAMEDGLSLQNKALDIQAKQLDLTSLKLEYGQTAQLEKYLSEVEFKKSNTSLNTTERSLENLKMSLKQLVQLTLTQEIELKQYDYSEDVEEPGLYDDYLNSALDNRYEIQSSKIDEELAQRKFEIMKGYIKDAGSVELLERKLDVDEKTAALEENKKLVVKDIKEGYKDLIEKKDSIAISNQRVENSSAQSKEMMEQYEMGNISESLLWNLPLGELQSVIGNRKALRDYDSALYSMKLARGIGPSYTGKAGGN